VVAAFRERPEFDAVPSLALNLDAGIAGPLARDGDVLGPGSDFEYRLREAAVLLGDVLLVVETSPWSSDSTSRARRLTEPWIRRVNRSSDQPPPPPVDRPRETFTSVVSVKADTSWPTLAAASLAAASASFIGFLA